MTSIAQFVYLFFILCLGIILSFTLFNIYNKSYRPKKTIVFNIVTVFLFTITSVLGFFSVTNLFSNLPASFNINNPNSSTNQSKQAPVKQRF